MSLVWREQLSVGNDVIDEDHKYLIGKINQIEGCLKQGKRSELLDVLDQLSNYAPIHFASEEKIASCVGYADLEPLHQSHEVLLKELDAVRNEILQATSDVSVERIGTFLREWLINHVIKEDLRLKPFLSKHAPTYDPR